MPRVAMVAATLACSLALIALFTPQLQPKREALGAVIGSLFTGANHPLAVLESSGRVIVALAEAACSGQTPEQEAAWQRSYDALWATAMYPSVEAALVAMGAR